MLSDPRHKMLWSLVLILILLDESDAFKFTIVHNNDMHARYDPMKGSSGKCPEGHDERGLCFGGLARVATAVSKARAEGPTLYLNAGDTFHGTSWYGVYRGQLAAELLNLLDLDAVALGNHEFDDDVAGLVPFLTKVEFPVVCCNLNVRRVPQLQGLENLVHSTVVTKLGRKIGIIGYITPLTKYYAPYNNIEYLDEISSINLEAKLLIMKGVNIIIALGHSGYEKDRMIALHCPDVDVVIGGHSHTFLYTGGPPDEEKPEGDYPTVMTRPNGQQVPVLQAYAFTKYLGKINLEFDDTGKLIHFNGTPLLLDRSIPQEAYIKTLLDNKRKKIDIINKRYLEERNLFLKTLKYPESDDENEYLELEWLSSMGYVAKRMHPRILMLELVLIGILQNCCTF